LDFGGHLAAAGFALRKYLMNIVPKVVVRMLCKAPLFRLEPALLLDVETTKTLKPPCRNRSINGLLHVRAIFYPSRRAPAFLSNPAESGIVIGVHILHVTLQWLTARRARYCRAEG
jgi:hypothetical protein